MTTIVDKLFVNLVLAERLRQAYPTLLEWAGVGSIPANSDAQNVPSFRRWRFELKLSPFWFWRLGSQHEGVGTEFLRVACNWFKLLVHQSTPMHYQQLYETEMQK